MSKALQRAEARARVAALGAPARAAAAEAIAGRIWTLPELASAASILLYASLPEEVSTDEIAREARRRGIQLIYPRCLPATRTMSLHRVRDVAELATLGTYGIREPDPECPAIQLAEVDVALVPGLAWDRDGGRLGRGAGYYDRLFASPSWRGFRCGLFFAAQEAPGLLLDSWDAPLDAVVTEEEAVRIMPPSSPPPTDG